MARFRLPDALLLSLASLALFLYLADDVLEMDWRAFDQEWWVYMKGNAPAARAWWISLAGAWIGYGLTLGVMIWLWVRGHRADFCAFGLVVLGAATLSFLLKHTFQIPRPVFEGLPMADGFSFPSGHTLYSSCIYGYVGLRLWSWSRPISGLVLTIPWFVAWSRLELGVHWVSDVLAGLLVGLFWVGLCLHLRPRFLSRFAA